MSIALNRQFVHQIRAMLVRNATTGASYALATAPKPQPEHYDIIIGGGGLVGTTFAAALSKTPVLADKRVLLLEGGPPFKGFNPSAPYGNRVSAINQNAVDLFKTIGAWDRMEAARVKPVKRMQVWDASSDALIHFHNEHFADNIACIIENDLMLEAVHSLLQDANAKKNVEIRNGVRIEKVSLPSENSSNYSEVHLKTGQVYSCDLLIGADGFNSVVRQQMGVNVFSVDYQRMGLVATVDVSDADDNAVAWQRFIPTGPIALLPLNDKTSSLVWSTTQEHARQLCEMGNKEFADAINEAFVKQYPKSELIVKSLNALNSLMGQQQNQQTLHLPPRVTGVQDNTRAKFPLGFLHAASYVSTGAALIGDAAHRIHPMAGQGVNLGYSDIRYLVEALSDAVYAGAKIGDKHYLIQYERKSLIKNIPILVGVHGLQSLYSTDFSPVVFLRSIGLQLTHNIPSIKNFFMKRAIG
ncbi:ubiquinone biosynthesis monooxygenase COQ6, mitochondrial [Teleopsis dalmanni]|uniref:ubiquinone biosynthesis monooxygenase COQ6, mitochondrial n=1 Tax=Teleopsis dalmanni TaxID=139649 RepID=UPI0018CFA54D|nr:ubiquinone biosynthesis monooxygenase COQ6, mitochondrial [Teleopsis dalmanni]